MHAIDSTGTDWSAITPHPIVRWWRGRMGWRFGAELGRMLGLFVVYKFVRLISQDEVGRAFDNSRNVIRFEQVTGLFTEQQLQELVLHNELLVRFLNTYYFVAHLTVTVAAFFFLYVARPSLYVVCRRMLIVMTITGAVLHVLYPLAPPRMMPSLGFVDTGNLFGPSPYGENTGAGLANQFAAMPSLHFGWAVLVSWALIVGLKTRWRYLGIAHPVLTLAAIILTANHYWLDAIVALAVFFALLVVHAKVRSHRQLAAEPDAPVEVVPASSTH